MLHSASCGAGRTLRLCLATDFLAASQVDATVEAQYRIRNAAPKWEGALGYRGVSGGELRPQVKEKIENST